MRISKKQMKSEIELLKTELEKKKVVFNYNANKIEDDFHVLNQMLDLKISHYENVIFVYNRYQEEKKVSVTSEEIDKSTKDIIYDSFKNLSEDYIEYLILKYFASKEAMIDTYTQRVYLRLFAFANTYNLSKTQDAFKKL